jgi:hypothetical protein
MAVQKSSEFTRIGCSKSRLTQKLIGRVLPQEQSMTFGRLSHLSALIFITVFSANASKSFADGTGGTKDKAPPAEATQWDVAFGGSLASDYIFRGISQSARWPSVSAYDELRYNPNSNLQFYAAIAGESIDYPNRAAAEIDLYGGVRPTFDKLSFDIGAWYYWYPGGRLFNGFGPLGPNPNCTNGFKLPGGCNVYEADLSYWEVFGKATYAPNKEFMLGANVFYSPSWLSEGADGLYSSVTAKLVLPEKILPKNLGVYVSTEVGHYWLGRTGAFYGNVDLPDYTTWNLGLAFTYKVFMLDLRYYDTDLSRGECNVLTSDHTATFNPSNISNINPSGLGSKWCGSAFVAKLSFDMTVKDNLK